ncbi:IclR family transcriptional regulator [Streptomyces marispadix]|uniref:IclR family transcriptional regulator n=1 Tax=Streptomyces marispadix TaxID=2922868 RepID=A0ABS9SW76_9ACTN|nr:IclR family transcriptional regulator [Streptomyces marispadix]MCH6160531.1 IclR family transcriptional regulator [Streptomyces marispadix]
MKNKPPYAIGSVDHALHLAQLLRQEGPLRVTDAAEQLGVSRSTAHRLLAMLVYRDFAEQIDDRRYRAGPVLRPTEVSEAPVALLRRIARPHLEALVERAGETANLMVLAGTEVRFLATVECDRVLRVGDRAGLALPAHLASGGKVLLSALGEGELERLYGGEEARDEDGDGTGRSTDDTAGHDAGAPSARPGLRRLRRELALVRERGFAVNDGLTETGLTAVGMAVHDPDGQPVAAVSLAAPTARFGKDVLPVWVAAISAAVTGIGRDLALASAA